MQRKKKMRKKIYSEQLLSVQKEKESQYPAQEIYVTGYVIELKKDCFFAGWQDGKILCRSYSYARYFGSVKSAEAYVKKNLAFAGLRCYICKVSWGLVIPVMESSMEENIKRYEKDGNIPRFSTFFEVKRYQKEHHLEHTTYALPLADREKEIVLAA